MEGHPPPLALMTARYAHVARKILREVTSPLDLLTPLVPRKDQPPK